MRNLKETLDRYEFLKEVQEVSLSDTLRELRDEFGQHHSMPDRDFLALRTDLIDDRYDQCIDLSVFYRIYIEREEAYKERMKASMGRE